MTGIVLYISCFLFSVNIHTKQPLEATWCQGLHNGGRAGVIRAGTVKADVFMCTSVIRMEEKETISCCVMRIMHVEHRNICTLIQ